MIMSLTYIQEDWQEDKMVDSAFNNVGGNVFGGMTDDDDDDLGFDLEGNPMVDNEDDPSITTPKKRNPAPDHSVQSSPHPVQSDDMFDDPVPDDSDVADPNDILDDINESGEFNDDEFNDYQDTTPSKPTTNPVEDNPVHHQQDNTIPAPQKRQMPALTVPTQQPYIPEQQYDNPLPQNTGQYPIRSQFEPVGTISNEPQPQQYPSFSTSIPSPDMIARIVVIADMLRQELNNDDKNAMVKILDMGPIKHDETSEMVYSVLNARKSTMQAVSDMLNSHEMDASARAFHLIRLDDQELTTIIKLGEKFGISNKNSISSDHVSMAETAASIISRMDDSMITIIGNAYNVYVRSQEVIHG